MKHRSLHLGLVCLLATGIAAERRRAPRCARQPRPRSPTIRPSSRQYQVRAPPMRPKLRPIGTRSPRNGAPAMRKRRDHLPIGLDDYVLTQPTALFGPAAADRSSRAYAATTGASGDSRGRRFPEERCRAIRLRAGPAGKRPRLQARLCAGALAAGLTRDQIVGVYAFETGGNGTYDSQAGLVPYRPGARAISPAVGYNQLLSTNTVSLLAEDGNRYLARFGKRPRH